MKVAIESSDRHFLERLHHRRGGTIQELCADHGVTATAVRQRLRRLERTGFVARELVRMGRGRPHYIYQITPVALRQMGENYETLAVVLWNALRRVEEPSVRASLVDGIEAALAQQLGEVPPSGTLNDRLARLTSALRERGFDVEVDHSGVLPILRENNCPYYELASRDSTICELERAVFRRLLGAEVTLTQCCLDGHASCEFQATPHA